MEPEIMLREAEVLVHLGTSHGPLWKACKEGLIPKPVKMGERATRWPASEIQAVIRARLAGRSQEEIRGLVAELERKRKEPQPA
jgi:prophage regulatory protein